MKRFSAKHYDIVAIITMSTCIIPILISYVIRDGGFHVNNSLSLYMGREFWSAILFAICNIIASYNIWQYIRIFKERYGKVWFYLGIVMIASFIGLSLCPYMLFGEGPITMMHQICSRVMFGAMAAMAFVQGIKDSGWRKAILYAYVVYGLVLAFLSFATQLFWSFTFIFEIIYIYGFMIMLLISAHRRSHQKDPQ